MEYQKIMNFVDNASNQPSKFRTKKFVNLEEDRMLIVKLNLKLQC